MSLANEGNESNECVVCYTDSKDCIPCEVCKKIVCVDCAKQMANISGFFCPACKAGKTQHPPLAPFINVDNPNIQNEEDQRFAMFQQMRDAFDILGPVIFTPINFNVEAPPQRTQLTQRTNHTNHIYNIVSNILDRDLGLENQNYPLDQPEPEE